MGTNMRRRDRCCILEEDDDEELGLDSCAGKLSYYWRKFKKQLHRYVPYLIVGVISVLGAFYNQSKLIDRTVRELYTNITDFRETLSSRMENIDNALTSLALSCRKTAGDDSGSTEELIKKHIRKYDADKTGMMDWALESLGGSILSVKGTESFELGGTSVLGIPCTKYKSDPRALIRPTSMPGDCWAFKGEGTVVIKLITGIYVSSFTLEHIGKEMTPDGEITSAPKVFVAWGVTDETPNAPKHCFGHFEYKSTGEPVQTFQVQQSGYTPFDKVEINFKTNHGNPDFTCVYRVRVHGQLTMQNLK